MFAAASGARLAHRHNKTTVKKQVSTSQIEGLQIHYKAFQRQQQLKYSGTPGTHGSRYTGVPQRRHNHGSKLYSPDCDSVLKLSASYIDLNGRISKLGHVDFEGKAAWQDRDGGQDLERRDSIGVVSEAASNHRCKQKEAHRRWVKRNRIHDSSFGDCSSEEEELYGVYGVQSAAANALLYIGLGTMCVGMIIAFVGTGEKGFKTMELRLIGPSLIGAGVMIIILRVMLCVCPSKCLRLNKHKHKHKNSTNKLNSEGGELNSHDNSLGREQLNEELVMADRMSLLKSDETKKRVSIVTMPTTSGVSKVGSTNFQTSGHPPTPEKPTYPVSINIPPKESSTISATISFLEHERGRPSSSKAQPTKIPNFISTSDDEDVDNRKSIELKPLDGSSFDISSFESATPTCKTPANLDDTNTLATASPEVSDVSIASLTNGILNSDSGDSEFSVKTVKNSTKFDANRCPKNSFQNEIVLSPSNLEELHEND